MNINLGINEILLLIFSFFLAILIMLVAANILFRTVSFLLKINFCLSIGFLGIILAIAVYDFFNDYIIVASAWIILIIIALFKILKANHMKENKKEKEKQ